jgi:glucose-1-phosphate thymidylyltransferase
VLAAGEGQRLRPFTATKPKVMIRVANKPILEYVVNALRNAGILDIVIVVGYKKERIIDYLGDGSSFGVKIKYAFQEQQLGTAHALKQAKDLVDDVFLVLPGDNIVDSLTIKCALKPWTLVYKKVEETSKYGAVVLRDSRIKNIIEKPKEKISNLANTGIYSFTKEIFEKIGEETSLVSVLNSLINDGFKINGVETKGTWMDVVYPWDILKVNDLAMNFSGKVISGRVESNAIITGNVQIGKNSVVRGNTYIKGPVVIGEGCEIGPNAVVMPSTSIGDNVVIGAHSFIANSVINNNVRMSAGCFIQESVVDRGCIIDAKFTANSGFTEVRIGEEFHKVQTGVFVGEGCRIAANVVAEPGSIVGNNSSIAAFKLLRGTILDNSTVL